MRIRFISTRTIGAAAVLAIAASLSAAAQQPTPEQMAGKTAEQVYQNIQVLNGIPADQVIPTMRFIAGALGNVECTFCHVGNRNTRASDDNKLKLTARTMIKMELAINKDTFGGRVQVTCYTCHRGAAEPVGVPVLSAEAAPAAPAAPEGGQAAAAGPSVDQILAKYVDALGGEQALRKITSRVITGTQELPAAGSNPPPQVQMELSEKAPNVNVTVLRAANGTTTSDGFDGTSSWARNRGQVTEATGVDLARAKRDADFYGPLDLKQEYGQMFARGTDKIGGRDVYRVIGIPKDDAAEQLYFDTQTGLLLRRVTFTVTPLGNDPTYTDFDDYRDTGYGVKMPILVKNYCWYARTSTDEDTVESNATNDGSKVTKPESKPVPRPAGQ